MVIAAISVLSILVTEFTYIAHVNQKMAFDSLDLLKAHYLAKSGLKLSLLRLKAYQNVKGVLSSLGGGASGGAAASAIPKQILEKIWSYPFFYPIPTNIPGLDITTKDKIEKFQKASGLEGRFSAAIESESSKYNLNQILAGFAPSANASPSPSPKPGASASPNPSATPSFSPEESRKSLSEYMGRIFAKKIESDEDFAVEYRDYRFDDLMDAIFAWADLGYERKNPGTKEVYKMKKGPFYSVSELHMIPGMDDQLYNLFAPSLTASTTPGININTMKENTFRALVPGLTDEEVTEFFKHRDSQEEDNLFKKDEDFFKYLSENITIFKRDPNAINRFKEDLAKRSVRLVVDETEFKITVQAQVNQSTRLIEAWVTLGQTTPPASKPTTGAQPISQTQPNASPTPGGSSEQSTAGLRITFMRVL